MGASPMSLRLKRNIGLPVMLAFFAAALLLAMGSQPVVAYSLQGNAEALGQGISLGGDAALRVASLVHCVQLLH